MKPKLFQTAAPRFVQQDFASPRLRPGIWFILIFCLVIFTRGMTAMAQDSEGPTVPAIQTGQTITLDGTGRDALWAKAAVLPALHLGSGEGEESHRVSRVQMARAGQYLLFGFDADEPDGICARECIHGTDLWFD